MSQTNSKKHNLSAPLERISNVLSRPHQIAVTGQQRTGTTALRKLLTTLPNTIDLGEIFSGHMIQSSFWLHLKSLAAQEPKFICPHFWYEAWEKYISKMQLNFSCDHLVFDLKGEHVPFVFLHRPTFEDRSSEFIFSWAGLKIISLERKNLLAQTISRLIMERGGESKLTNPNVETWRIENAMKADSLQIAADAVREAEAVDAAYAPRIKDQPDVPLDPDMKLVFDPNEIEREVRGIQRSNAFIRQAVGPLEPLRLYYEHLFDETGMFSRETLDALAAHLDVAASDFYAQPLMIKQADKHFLAPVANRKEIIEHFRKTEFEWMVQGQ